MMVLSKFLPLAVYPLGICLELLLLSLILIYLKKIKTASLCICLSVFVLLFFSSQPVSNWLAKGLERKYLPISEQSVKADAIVVLGGGCRPAIFPRNHVEYNEGAERVFEGIRLYKAGAAPYVIPTGGGIDFILKGQKEGNDMREVMIEYGVPDSAVMAETEARNTYENAVYVKKLMKEKKIGMKVILVTSAMHMPRSQPIFKKAGFDVIPVPVDYLVDDGQSSFFYSLLPKTENLALSTQVIKEHIGIIIYKMLGWL